VVLTFGDHRLDIARRELRRGADIIDLEPKAFDLLAFLVLHRDRVVTKDDLLQAVGAADGFRAHSRPPTGRRATQCPRLA
jgi:DNA-binding winged helix-turn-helix (wHTH) protein